jgi:hypothetical protein
MARARDPVPDQLSEVVERIIEKRRGQPRISPTWVATEAMRELDRHNRVERQAPLIWAGCHLELRQIARRKLANRFDPESDDDARAKDQLFPELQWRYPTMRSAAGEEPEYVLRDLLIEEDIDHNVARLRAEADSKNQHADALEAWGRSRRTAA